MKVQWRPQPKQAQALVRLEDEILFGGARGGGKTDAGMAWLLYDIDKPGYRALVIRKNFTDLSDWIDRAKEFFGTVGGTYVGDTFKFPSGALIKTGHLADKDAYTKYQGHEYQKILIEELSHIPLESYYLKLIASCRSTVDGISAQVFNTTNPDPPGLDWIKDRWNIPEEPATDQIYTNEISVEVGDEIRKRRLVFIPSFLEDNPILKEKDPGYETFLESLQETDKELYEAWRKGKWGGFSVEGAYYREQLKKAEQEGRIRPNLYDEYLPVYTWCDIGIGDSFAIGYFQTAHNEWRVIDYDEFEGESLGEAINRMRNKPYTYEAHFAPHDMRVRELGTGKSRQEVAESLGVEYEIVPNLSIEDGINSVRMRFARLYLDEEKAALLIKRLTNYRKEFDDKRGIWKNKPVHDVNSHGADMMRYWGVTDVTSSEVLNNDILIQARQMNRSMR